MDPVERFRKKFKEKCIDLKIQSVPISGKPKKLKAVWKMEELLEMEHEVGDGVVERIAKAIDEEIFEGLLKEIELEKIREKIRNAPD